MSRNKLSPTELLDMAREVLNVCSDHALKDILEDLEITNSSEQTINRILDGQVNTRFFFFFLALWILFQYIVSF